MLPNNNLVLPVYKNFAQERLGIIAFLQRGGVATSAEIAQRLRIEEGVVKKILNDLEARGEARRDIFGAWWWRRH